MRKIMNRTPRVTGGKSQVRFAPPNSEPSEMGEIDDEIYGVYIGLDSTINSV